MVIYKIGLLMIVIIDLSIKLFLMIIFGHCIMSMSLNMRVEGSKDWIRVRLGIYGTKLIVINEMSCGVANAY